MNSEAPQEIGRSILALFCALVGILGLFAAGSYYMVGSVRAGNDDWALSAAGALLLGLAYLYLAWMLWIRHRAMNWFAPGLLILLAGWAVLDMLADDVLDLAAALLFFLAAVANMTVIAWLRMARRNG